VQRDEPLAVLDEVQERLLLGRGDPGDVGVDDQAVVGGERFRVEGGDPVGVHQVDAPPGQDRLELAEALGGPVVPVVAQEQDLDRPLRRGGGEGRRGQGQGEGQCRSAGRERHGVGPG
jgi:hypothetical protein